MSVCVYGEARQIGKAFEIKAGERAKAVIEFSDLAGTVAFKLCDYCVPAKS